MKGLKLLGSSSDRQYLRAALKRRTRRIFKNYSPRKFHIKPMKDLAPTVTAHVFLSNYKPAYCELLASAPVVRTSSLDIISHDKGAAFAKLSEKYADKSYVSTAINALRLKNVYVDGLRGVCVTSDAMMVDEITAVARGIDPRLAHVAFLSMNDETFTPDDYPVIDHPVLHCIHPAGGAFGHFLFDILTVVAYFRQSIVDGMLKLLTPNIIPDWAMSIFKDIGIGQEHLVQLGKTPVICRNVTMISTMSTYNTFFPNQVLTGSPAKALGLNLADRWESPAEGRRIYLSRENQRNFFNRGVENEAEVRSMLTTLGFEIIEPSNLPFREQIEMIDNASIIIGPHGSGFGNLMFARRGTAVIDLMPDDYGWNTSTFTARPSAGL